MRILIVYSHMRCCSSYKKKKPALLLHILLKVDAQFIYTLHYSYKMLVVKRKGLLVAFRSAFYVRSGFKR